MKRHRAGLQIFADRCEHGLGAIGADRARRHQKIDHGADGQRSDQADGQVALGIAGFLGRGGDGIEADIGKEDGRPRLR